MLLIRWCTLTPSPHRRHVSPHLGGVTRTLCAFCTTRSDYSRKLDSPITGSPDSSKKNWFARTQIYAPLLPILAFSIEIVTSILQIMQISYFMFTVVDSLPPPAVAEASIFFGSGRIPLKFGTDWLGGGGQDLQQGIKKISRYFK